MTVPNPHCSTTWPPRPAPHQHPYNLRLHHALPAVRVCACVLSQRAELPGSMLLWQCCWGGTEGRPQRPFSLALPVSLPFVLPCVRIYSPTPSRAPPGGAELEADGPRGTRGRVRQLCKSSGSESHSRRGSVGFVSLSLFLASVPDPRAHLGEFDQTFGDCPIALPWVTTCATCRWGSAATSDKSLSRRCWQPRWVQHVL